MGDSKEKAGEWSEGLGGVIEGEEEKRGSGNYGKRTSDCKHVLKIVILDSMLNACSESTSVRR